MGDLIQIVDRITADATVLLDLNDDVTFTTSVFSAPPPELRRGTQSSAIIDGDVETFTAYSDRELQLNLELITSTQDDSADKLQQLGRLLNRDEGWLRYQPNGVTRPVFFMLRRTSPVSIQDWISAAAARDVVLRIPAAPFAFGLPESDTVTIRNHPLAGTNRMCAVLPPAKGDVPAPLVLDFPTPGREGGSASNARYRSVVASWSPKGVTPTTVPECAAPTDTGTGPGTTATDTADTAFARGVKTRITPSSYPSTRDIPFTLTVEEAGDYRIFVRGAASGPDIRLELWRGVGGVGGRVGDQLVRINRPTTVRAEWFDLGVVRLPLSAVDSDDPFGLSPSVPPAQLALRTVFLETTDQTFDLDVMMAVPVDEDSTFASQSTTPMPASSFGTTTVTLTLDGVNDRRYASWLSSGGNQRHQHVGGTSGALPTVSPDGSTQVTFIPVVAYDPATWTATEIGDLPITTDTVVNWKYFPRYLYLRGAS